MNVAHENIELICEYLDSNRIEFSEITDELVWNVYANCISKKYPVHKMASKAVFLNKVMLSCELIRRNLSRVLYIRNGNRSTGIRSGYVYGITNPAYPGWVKIGSSIEPLGRLESYQTYSPYRDFELVGYFFSTDRLTEEKSIISKYNGEGEWCKVDRTEVKRLISDRTKASNIKLPKYLYENTKLNLLLTTPFETEHFNYTNITADVIKMIKPLLTPGLNIQKGKEFNKCVSQMVMWSKIEDTKERYSVRNSKLGLTITLKKTDNIFLDVKVINNNFFCNSELPDLFFTDKFEVVLTKN